MGLERLVRRLRRLRLEVLQPADAMPAQAAVQPGARDVRVQDLAQRAIEGAIGSGPMANAASIALGVLRDGECAVLGFWIADTEGARFWLSVRTDLRNRGVQDIPIATADGLKGFPGAITAAFLRSLLDGLAAGGAKTRWPSGRPRSGARPARAPGTDQHGPGAHLVGSPATSATAAASCVD